eukprot:CAMPEP_0119026432 /NCGR_PEP_ID=MMETSP1176-20130426/35443_1 /TAXON_ID=265551 /ORGANISM="Synedropsis recta cf, Strain CCMP1620" /LENGTH=292 /DNA_ID=CAMNT_0006982145 /DNA_START=39 /DNA_END=914 /DNA_ORIENTATION=+
MSTLLWIIIFGLLMSCIALVGSLTLFLPPDLLERLLLPLIAFAAGSLIGGALFHMIPAAVEQMGNVTAVYVWMVAGFTLFFAVEQFLNSWHHSHSRPCIVPLLRASEQVGGGTSQSEEILREDEENRQERGNTTATAVPVSSNSTTQVEEHSCSTECGGLNQVHLKTKPIIYLILIADALHNFIGGLFVGASFVTDVNLGIAAWIASAVHEVPQELGDFAVLVHSGWGKRRSLVFNFLSALTFLLGGLIAYAASETIDVAFLIPFAAGNFIYIGATDLIPEVKKPCNDARKN